MRERDLLILNEVKKFRYLSRDDIAFNFFKNNRYPISGCNGVLRRLVRDGYLKVNKTQTQHIYQHVDNDQLNVTSYNKIAHYRAIYKFKRETEVYKGVGRFEVEPKVDKGYPEPDGFLLWHGIPFFIEIQLTKYSKRQINDKVRRYEYYFKSNDWKTDFGITEFPKIWIITEGNYPIEPTFLQVFQTKNVHEYVYHNETNSLDEILYGFNIREVSSYKTRLNEIGNRSIIGSDYGNGHEINENYEVEAM